MKKEKPQKPNPELNSLNEKKEEITAHFYNTYIGPLQWMIEQKKKQETKAHIEEVNKIKEEIEQARDNELRSDPLNSEFADKPKTNESDKVHKTKADIYFANPIKHLEGILAQANKQLSKEKSRTMAEEVIKKYSPILQRVREINLKYDNMYVEAVESQKLTAKEAAAILTELERIGPEIRKSIKEVEKKNLQK